MSQPFWLEDPTVLFNDHFKDVIPRGDQSLNERLNSIFRLSLYLGGLLLLLTMDLQFIFLPIAVGIFTMIVKRKYKNNVETFFSEYGENRTCERVAEYFTAPTKDNPFMNIDLIGDPKDKPPATPYYDNEEVARDVEDKFNSDLYRDTSDVYGKRNSQRQFYTTPSTVVPGNQTSFAKFLFNLDTTAKESGIKAAPYSI